MALSRDSPLLFQDADGILDWPRITQGLDEHVDGGWLDSWSDLAGDAAGGALARIAVLTGVETKGLEFDGIVVVAPDEIEAESVTGRSTLYVVLTRATQRMVCVTT